MWNAMHILQLTGGRGNLSCMRNFLHRPLALTHISSLGRKEGKGMEGQVMSYKRQYVTSGPEWAAEEAGEECEEDMPWSKHKL